MVKQFAQLNVVKSVAQYSLASGAACVGVYGFFKLLSHISSKSTESNLESLKEHVPTAQDAQNLSTESNLLDLMDRMKNFSQFAPDEYRYFVVKSLNLARSKKVFDEKVARGQRVRMYEAKDIRNLSQAWIESIRYMRAILELQKPHLLDDFDEVAVDCQNYHNDVSESAMFDAQLAS